MLSLLIATMFVFADCDSVANPIDKHQIQFALWNVEKDRGVMHAGFSDPMIDDDFLLFQEISQAGVLGVHEARPEHRYSTIFNRRDFGVASVSLHRPCEAFSIDVADEPIAAKIDKAIVVQKFVVKDSRGHRQTLAIVNIHLPLFIIGGWPGQGAYKTALKRISDVVNDHCGPVVVAGDFNGWSPNRRWSILPRFQQQLGLSEINFDREGADQLSATLKLDRVYYRGLSLQRSEMLHLDSEASDHPLLKFAFELEFSGECQSH